MTQSKLTTYLAVAMVTGGFLLMFLAWNGASEVDFVQGQLPYVLSGSAPGLGLVLAGLVLALVQEMRRNTATIAERLDRLAGLEQQEVAALGLASVPTDGDHVVATTSTYHSPDCRVVDGRKDLTPMSPEDADARGLDACRVCEPQAA